ncbi:MAG: ABC transporter permease [Clostridiales bacterium]|jgi:D-methionine transport system permease protein|nr:ABC transporter permease [Clostridiales bacterium]
MSLLNTPFWEVLKASFAPEVWAEILPAAFDTLYMTLVASAITLVFGFALGVAITVTRRDGLLPAATFNAAAGWLINCFRSLPQMIMIILMIPVARLVFGRSYGMNSCIIALAASCVPMYARIVESSLLEISKGKIEAAKSMGSGNLRIIFRVLLPETLPSLIRGFTVAVVAIISMSALAGNFGAGGIGDIAVRFGFQRFRHEVLFACVYVLVVIVQAVQFAGDTASKLILKKRRLI